jgi:hypothetical protein
MQQQLKDAAQLERKGRDPMLPARLVTGEDPRVLYFVFPRGAQPIEASEKEVTFHIRTDRMDLRARFVPKEMTYAGELAL